MNAEYGNDRKFIPTSSKSINLIELSGDIYNIEETENQSGKPVKSTVATFGINGIDTMLGKDLILRTDASSYYLRMELYNPRNAQQLFNRTTRSKLGRAVSINNLV